MPWFLCGALGDMKAGMNLELGLLFLNKILIAD